MGDAAVASGHFIVALDELADEFETDGQDFAYTVGKLYTDAAEHQMTRVAGRVDFMVADVPFLLPQIQSGRLRALAVLNNARSPLLPNIPTLKEQGLVGYDLAGWIGLSGPAGMPADVVASALSVLAKKPVIAQAKQRKHIRPA